MNNSQAILNYAKQNNGIITNSMIVSAGFSRGILKYLVEQGQLEKSSRGVYTLPEVWEDEFVSVQNRFKKGVFSLDTALFLYDLTDRTPYQFHMTFPGTYNLTNPKKEGILCTNTKEPLFSIGIENVQTPAGNTVRAYNAERTLCDILKPRYHTDVQIVTDAFKKYITGKDKNIPLLSEYAHLLKVESKLRAYLEVLL